MSQTLRHPQILKIAREDGRVTVDGLAERLGVTPQTIRRDLSDLASSGRLERIHGGAMLPSGVSNIGYEDRQGINASAKQAIARACAAEIPDNASVFLNIGTSTEAVARELTGHRNLMVLTNNMNVANILAANSGCEIILVGGVLRRSDGGLVGDLTTAMIERFKFDIAVIGCSALDCDGDLLDFDFQEVNVSRTIMRQARRTFLVADAHKFQRSAPVRIASLEMVDVFYTDAPPPAPLAARCREWGTDIRVCPVRTGTTASSR